MSGLPGTVFIYRIIIMRKKNIILGLFLLVFLLVVIVSLLPFNKKRDSYIVNVELNNTPNHFRVSLMNWDTQQDVTKEFIGESSIDISFTGSVSDLSFFYLEFYEILEDEKRIIPHLSKIFYIGNEEVTIQGEIDSINVSTDSKTQNVLEQWYSESKHIKDPLRDVKMKLFEDYKKGAFESTSYKNNLVIYRDLVAQEKNAVAKFISKHPDSETAAYLLYRFYERLPMDTVRKLYDILGKTIRQNKYNDPIEIYLTTKVLELGDYWYDFTAFNIEGDSLLLSELEQSANKYMLLVFARRGCMPCENSISELKTIYEKHHEELEIVSYYQDISASDLKVKAEINEIEWTYLGSTESDYRSLRAYDVDGVPKFVLISPERKITYSWKKGYERGLLLEKLDNYFKYSRH